MAVPQNKDTFDTYSPAETIRLGIRLAGDMTRGDCIILNGGLGAGKTVLARGITEGLGGDPDLVTSPTYVLVNEYPLPDDEMILFHLDLFRLSSPNAELASLGIEEMLAEGILVVEWGDRAQHFFPVPHYTIDIEIKGAAFRRFVFQTVD